MGDLRVLLVDDEEELVTTLVERLGFRGIQADYALDGYQALEKMKSGNYHVVVLDLKLPGMEGTDVLRRISHDYPGVPVLLITGHGSPIDGPSIQIEGAFDYLVKPVKLDVMVDRIREAAAAYDRQ